MTPEISRQFDNLSLNHDTLKPLTPIDIDITVMRSQLVESGINLNLSEAERTSLSETKFRNLDSGRGPGIVAALGSKKAEILLSWCHQRSQDGPRLKKGNLVADDSQGRGLRQLAADIIQLSANPNPTPLDIESFCLKINQRVLKGLLWETRNNLPAQEEIIQKFSSIPRPDSTLASVPPGSVADLWNFLTSSQE